MEANDASDTAKFVQWAAEGLRTDRKQLISEIPAELLRRLHRNGHLPVCKKG